VNLLGDGLRDRPAGSKRLGASLFGRGSAQKAKA
jgi:peptide/nickel transport system permease protein